MTSHFDLLIIGAGGAGCILSRRLAELCPNARIGLLEAGGEGRRLPFLGSDLGSVFQTWGPDSNWQLKTIPQSGLANRSVSLTQGKVLGGGTSVNAMMYVHGDKAVLEEWHRCSGHHPGWDPVRFLNALHALEACDGEGFDPSIRGVDGPIRIRSVPHPSASALAFLEASRDLGYRLGDFNDGRQLDTAGLMQLNLLPDGGRCSMPVAFLVEGLPDNLELLLSSQVERLVLNGARCSGVTLVDGRELTADHLVVCAGAFQTPALLMASGIGEPAVLEAASIPCRIANAAVGTNLSDHLRVMVAYSSDRDPGVTEFLCEAALFTRSGLSDAAEADIQINFSAGVDGFIPPQFLPSPAPPHTVIFVPVLARPLSKGSVRPLGPRLRDGFGIDPGYLSHPTDIEVYSRAVALARDLAATSSLAPYCRQELCPGEMTVADYLRSHAETIWHPVGSCAMGSDPASSSCSPDFRLRGTDNVFVADASVLPSLPSGNPQAAIFAMASLAAAAIADALRG